MIGRILYPNINSNTIKISSSYKESPAPSIRYQHLAIIIAKKKAQDIKNKLDKKVLSISAKERDGIDTLEQTIEEMFFHGKIQMNDEVYITNARQKNDISNAYESMKLVLNSIEDGMPEDFYTIDLMNAYELLGRVVGEAIEDDLVDKIFSKFCMGK